MANLVSRKAKGSSATADMKRRDLAFWTRRIKALPRNKEAKRKRREEKRRDEKGQMTVKPPSIWPLTKR